MNEGCRVNNANIGSILKELTKSMENMNATPSEIATMQKDFLSQFGINVGDIFMERASINIENCDMTEDEKSIVEYLRNTNEKYVCSIMIWQEALKRKGKPTKSQTAKIRHIIDMFCDDYEKVNYPIHTDKYGSQRCWIRKEVVNL